MPVQTQRDFDESSAATRDKFLAIACLHIPQFRARSRAFDRRRGVHARIAFVEEEEQFGVRQGSMHHSYAGRAW